MPNQISIPKRYSGLQLSHHGGRCCGIRHIHGFCISDPKKSTLPAIPARVPAITCYEHNYPGENFFSQEAPEETYLERLDRLLAFCDANRPHGMIEVSLIDMQRKFWEKFLEERGFKLVADFRNSNTQNTVYFYVRCK